MKPTIQFLKARAMNIFKHISLLALTIAVAATPWAMAQQATFSVNMEHAFLQPGDKVVVRGNIEALGGWTSQGELPLKKNARTGVYSAELKSLPSGVGEVLYKYVIVRSDGTEQWEQRGNRVFNLESTETVWFSDRAEPGTQQTVVQVTFRLDLSNHGMNGYPAEAVALMGARTPLSFDLEAGRTPMAQTSAGIWEATVAFPFGTPHDIPFKFAWKHNDEWMWEWRAGHTNHVFLIDDSQTSQLIQLRYEAEKPGVVAVEGTSGQVDDYDAVIARLGQRGPQSRYVYEKAMEQLTAGQITQAEATYATYKAAHPGGEEIDDFAYRMVYALEKTQGYEAAKTYLNTQRQSETIPERKAYFEYLEGELALNAGRPNQARKAFRKVAEKSEWDIATRYSNQAIVHSYLTEADPDSIQKGVQLLEQHAALAPQAEQRSYTVRLARAYRAAGMRDQHEQALATLATMGTERQQARSKLDLGRTYLRHGKHSQALETLETVNDQLLPGYNKGQKMRLQLEAYHQLDRHREFARLFDEYSRKYPDDPHRKRLAGFEQNARKRLGTGWAPPGRGQGTATPDSTQHRRGPR